VDQRGDIRGIGITVADEASRARSLVNSCFEDPAVGYGIGYILLKGSLDTMASPTLSKPKQASMGHIPVAIQQLNLAAPNREAEPLRKVLEALQVSFLNFSTPEFTCEAAI